MTQLLITENLLLLRKKKGPTSDMFNIYFNQQVRFMSHLCFWQLNLFKPLCHKMRGKKYIPPRAVARIKQHPVYKVLCSVHDLPYRNTPYVTAVLCFMQTSEDTRTLCIINVGIRCMPILGNLRFFFYFEFKGLIPYLCFNNKLLVTSMQHHILAQVIPQMIYSLWGKLILMCYFQQFVVQKADCSFFLEFNTEMVFNH